MSNGTVLLRSNDHYRAAETEISTGRLRRLVKQTRLSETSDFGDGSLGSLTTMTVNQRPDGILMFDGWTSHKTTYFDAVKMVEVDQWKHGLENLRHHFQWNAKSKAVIDIFFKDDERVRVFKNRELVWTSDGNVFNSYNGVSGASTLYHMNTNILLIDSIIYLVDKSSQLISIDLASFAEPKVSEDFRPTVLEEKVRLIASVGKRVYFTSSEEPMKVRYLSRVPKTCTIGHSNESKKWDATAFEGNQKWLVLSRYCHDCRTNELVLFNHNLVQKHLLSLPLNRHIESGDPNQRHEFTQQIRFLELRKATHVIFINNRALVNLALLGRNKLHFVCTKFAHNDELRSCFALKDGRVILCREVSNFFGFVKIVVTQ